MLWLRLLSFQTAPTSMSYLYEVFEHFQLFYRHMAPMESAGDMFRWCSVAVASMSLQNQADTLQEIW